MTLEHGAVRETLVKTTLKLMEQRGLEGVKARTVAELAGVSVGTIYNLFGSFDQLILAANMQIYEALGRLGAQRMAEINADIKRCVAAGSLADTAKARVLARLLGLGETYVEFIAANANRWAALLAFNRTRGLRDNEDNLQQLNALVDIVARVLEEAPRWPSPRHRRVVARGLWSAVHGIVTMNFFSGPEAEARGRTSEILDLVLTTLVDGMFAEQQSGG